MGIFMGSSRFAKRKRLTEPIVKCPKNMRESLNIIDYRENGIFRLEPGEGVILYDSCYVFEDMNYTNKNEDEKEYILKSMMRWLNTMNVDFKITKVNKYQDMTAYLDRIFHYPNGDQYPVIKEGIESWKKQKLDTDQGNVNQVSYLTVTCRALSFEEAKSFFNTLDREIVKNFVIWGSKIHRLSAKERFMSLRSFFFREEKDLDTFQRYFDHGDMRNTVLPASLEQERNFMRVGEQYVSVLFGHDFASSLGDEIIHNISKLSYPSLITLDYAPVDRTTLKDKLAAAHTNNERAIEEEMDGKAKAGRRSLAPSYRKEKAKDELESYRDQVDTNSENGFFLGLIVVLTARSEGKLATRVEGVKNLGRKQGVLFDTYDFLQLKALHTALPYGGRQVNHMRNFLTSSVVAFQPFYAQDIQEENGYLYGLNKTTKRAVIANRKKLKGPHGIIVGHTGSGKSMTSIKMTEIAQTLLATDDDVMMIDPQDEMAYVCPKFGGQYLDFSPKGNLYMNGFEVPADVFFGDENTKSAFVTDMTTYATMFCEAIMNNITVTQEHLSIIGRCVRLMYNDVFSRTRLKTQPTLCTLRKKLKQEQEKAITTGDQELIRVIYNSLEEYTEGKYNMFSKPTNFQIDNRFTCFGIKNVPEHMWEPVMGTIMNFLATRMEYNQSIQRATHFIVDEAQVVCQRPTSAKMLLSSVVTFRKYGGICTLAMQNLKRAIENPDLREMFSNCEYKCFFDQGGVDALALAEIQELTRTEFLSLSEEKPGHGVMVWGKKVILLDGEINRENPLFDLFDTNFLEKAEKRTKESR
ncbi:VirB4-like conjugal transfer ATPase, CD1110 family [Ohessyouella blattaphilus]|uniref:TraG P-loop domain-containing protein n=1 Tax=Ohessyouella blattaphilus TaxID=2949333 RepID=A0ABT1EHT3_9FIRM|nr:hypothetical protein [Ohessyouella blattaphilus]MCP1110261.1 hypothetical protein [Ohessyouella blattaphilus]MCR8563655.1 hypothetical protein [Ohessyouella blattaphilus]